jgi:hypothetical protein
MPSATGVPTPGASSGVTASRSMLTPKPEVPRVAIASASVATVSSPRRSTSSMWNTRTPRRSRRAFSSGS